jgi:hypothetical protein
MMRKKLSMIGSMAVILLASTIVDSQESPYFPDMPGEWQNKIYTEDIFQYFSRNLGFSLEHVNQFRANVRLIIDAIRRTPVFNPPLGFQAVATTQWRSHGLPASAPMSAEFQVVFYYFINEGGKPAWGGEANSSFCMKFNPANPLNGYEFLKTPDGFVIYEEPRETSRYDGATVYDEGLIMLHKPNRRPWIPATGEQYLTAWLKLRAADIAKIEADTAAYDASGPYKAFLADKPNRQKAMEETYRKMKQSNPQKAEEMRAQWQKTEEGMEAGLKRNQVPAAAGNNRGVDALRAKETETRHLLESMTPSQKSSPAWYKADGDKIGAGLADPSVPGARAMVIPNPDIYDRSLPQSDIQVITVVFEGFRGHSDRHIGRIRLLQFRDTADWARISKLIAAR